MRPERAVGKAAACVGCGHPAWVGQWQQDCTTFATTIQSLWADTYTGEASLLDPSGRARTTTIDMQPFTVTPEATVVVSLDFPAPSRGWSMGQPSRATHLMRSGDDVLMAYPGDLIDEDHRVIA